MYVVYLERLKIEITVYLCYTSYYLMTNVAITRVICFIAQFVLLDSTHDCRIFFTLKAFTSFIYHKPVASLTFFSMKAAIVKAYKALCNMFPVYKT